MNDTTQFIKKNMKNIDRDKIITINITDTTNSANMSKKNFEQKINFFENKGYNKKTRNYTEYCLSNKTLNIQGNKEKCYMYVPIDNIDKLIGFKKLYCCFGIYKPVDSELFPCKREYNHIRNIREISYEINNLFRVVFINYDDNYICRLDITKQNIYEDMFYNNFTQTIQSILE